ncbi:MAG: histidinol phosphate phosphatase [Clostridiaceae bacterium]|jgi:histidinol-phosphatase (PHP family)|nr:histidinol phosphate phosphatase [Clostridiaceae bacterium]
MIDGHVHLEKGPLTLDYIDKFVQYAQKARLDSIQILDHTHRFMEFAQIYEELKSRSLLQEKWLNARMKDHISDYICLIKKAKEQEYPINVKFGLEVCYTRGTETLLKNILKQYKFDFLVGAVHSVFGYLYDIDDFSRDLLWSRYSVEEIYKEYYNNLESLLESGLFTQTAHPDVIKLYNIYPDYDLSDTYENISRIAFENDIYMENNFGCHYRYGHKDLGLSDQFLSVLRDKKVKIILASDAHVPNDVGRCFDEYIKRAAM